MQKRNKYTNIFYHFLFVFLYQSEILESPHGIMAKVLDYDLKVSEFKLQ